MAETGSQKIEFWDFEHWQRRKEALALQVNAIKTRKEFDLFNLEATLGVLRDNTKPICEVPAEIGFQKYLFPVGEDELGLTVLDHINVFGFMANIPTWEIQIKVEQILTLSFGCLPEFTARRLAEKYPRLKLHSVCDEVTYHLLDFNDQVIRWELQGDLKPLPKIEWEPKSIEELSKIFGWHDS